MKFSQQIIYLVIVFLYFPTLNHAWWSTYWDVTATGCVKCFDEPVKFTKVKLMDDDWYWDETMGSTRTDKDGCFKVTGKGRDWTGKPDPYVKVEYDYSGQFGEMQVETTFGFRRYDKTSTRYYKRTIDFGNITVSNIHCKSYLRFYDAMEEFKERTGMSLPYKKLYIQTGSYFYRNFPYSSTNVVKIPKRYPTSSVTKGLARHELALTVRHSYDGSYSHFLHDAFVYGYGGKHDCSTKSNLGFAFDEGWANFWQGECEGEYGQNATDYRYEGNVAKALRKLMEDCEADYKQMVNVLNINKGTIHSFSSYKDKFEKKYEC